MAIRRKKAAAEAQPVESAAAAPEQTTVASEQAPGVSAQEAAAGAVVGQISANESGPANPAVVRYEADELIRQARELFGVSPIAAVGAFADRGFAPLTVEQARQSIHQFMNRKVN